jgi:antitoxin ParD1/3/4
MTKIEKLSIAVTHEQADALRRAVNDGAFASTSEAVRDALRDWTEKRADRALAVTRIRELWDEGIASGVARRRRSAEEIIAAGEKRLAGRKAVR